MTTPKKPQDHKKSPKPSEIVDADLEQEELRRELLSDLPNLRPAHKFRIGHRHAFQNLLLEAVKSGIFEDDEPLSFDMTKPKDIERLQKMQKFVASIDEWAESIAETPEVYEAWSEGKTEDHFLALFVVYRDALGESNSSVS